MKTVIALAGAFLAAVLLLLIVDVYTPERTLLEPPLLLIFFVIWSIGFGYATVEANLKKKIIAVLTVEGAALAVIAGYYIITSGFDRYIFHFTLGVSAIIIMLLLREKK